MPEMGVRLLPFAPARAKPGEARWCERPLYKRTGRVRFPAPGHERLSLKLSWMSAALRRRRLPVRIRPGTPHWSPAKQRWRCARPVSGRWRVRLPRLALAPMPDWTGARVLSERVRVRIPPGPRLRFRGNVSCGRPQLRRFARGGGEVLFGTDVGYMADYDPTDEYVLMGQAGLSFQQVLASLTTAPAARVRTTIRAGRVIFSGPPEEGHGALRDARR